jgi:hypothetical protein
MYHPVERRLKKLRSNPVGFKIAMASRSMFTQEWILKNKYEHLYAMI